MHVSDELYAEQLPRECILECSVGEDVSAAVAYWRGRLDFSVDRARAIACLVGYGWQRDELADTTDETLAECVLWVACCAFMEGASFFTLRG